MASVPPDRISWRQYTRCEIRGPTGNRTLTLCLQGRSAHRYHYGPINDSIADATAGGKSLDHLALTLSENPRAFYELRDRVKDRSNHEALVLRTLRRYRSIVPGPSFV